MSSITVRTFGLAAPYWLRSSHRASGWALGAALLVSVALMTGLSYELTALQKTFFDALEKRQTPAFTTAITSFFLGVAALVSTMVARAWMEQALEIRWRSHLTAHHEKPLSAWRSGFFHGKTNRRGAYSDLSIIQYG